jgi:murein L,D-transpeptidase YcbB/YkuD
MNVKQSNRTTDPPVRWACVLLVLLHGFVQAAPALPGTAASDTVPTARTVGDARTPTPGADTGGAALPWLEDGQAQARVALRLLDAAAEHGLDPARYRSAELVRRLDRVADPAAAAAFERDLDAAMRQFLYDLHFGRTASDYPPPAAAGFDPGIYLHQAVRENDLAAAVEAAAPAVPLYRRVKSTLAQYRALSHAHPDWPHLPPAAGGASIAAGATYDGAGILRQRLQLLGDLDPGATAEGKVYTPELSAAVRRFQARHGLTEDGVLGPNTFAALAVAPSHRVDQLALTLERLRRLPALPKGRTVVVNLPAYRLWAFDGRNDPSAAPLEMRVIVGTAARTPTPLFIGQMRYLEFNPYWNVPRSIQVGEIIPRLARNPSYLEQNGMELVSASGQPLSAGAGDPVAALRAGTARVRQRPGPGNVLGEVKFAMPNPMNIYLHSTSAQELFKRSRRDLSHGCIRVEHPAELAQFVLANPQTWHADSVAAAMRSGRTRRVMLPAAIPVVLFYATAVTDRQGRALFAEDIYRRDPPLMRALHGE